jgi:hypothetical protein
MANLPMDSSGTMAMARRGVPSDDSARPRALIGAAFTAV